VLGQDPQHRGRRQLLCRPARMTSASSSGPVHCDSGIPVAAGSWQASATTAARVSSLIRRGLPERGRSVSPARPRAANRPRHLRTVSTVTRRPAAILALSRPRAAASTIWARNRSRYAVFAPRARFLNVGQRDRHRAGQRHDGSRRETPMRNTAPGHVIITRPDACARDNEARVGPT
jgi:hypothetical protein